MLVDKKYVPRHKMQFVFCHDFNAVVFMLLVITALPLLFDSCQFIYNTFGAGNVQTAHHILGVLFILNPIVGFFVARDGYKTLFKEVKSFDKDDVEFNKKFPVEFIGIEAKVPPQSFYNGGEKFNILLQFVLCGLIAISGLLLWQEGTFTSDYKPFVLIVHSLCAMFAFAAAMGHIYLAVIVNPPSLKGMTSGCVNADYACHHHGKWIDELVAEGKVTRDELEEAHKLLTK